MKIVATEGGGCVISLNWDERLKFTRLIEACRGKVSRSHEPIIDEVERKMLSAMLHRGG